MKRQLLAFVVLLGLLFWVGLGSASDLISENSGGQQTDQAVQPQPPNWIIAPPIFFIPGGVWTNWPPGIIFRPRHQGEQPGEPEQTQPNPFLNPGGGPPSLIETPGRHQGIQRPKPSETQSGTVIGEWPPNLREIPGHGP
ncbi:MAG: hypothetical protein ABH878_00355 [bacterium]